MKPVFALLLVIICIGVCGCNKSSATATQTQLMLDWHPEPEFGGFYAAQSAGIFSRHGITIDIQSAGEGAPTWQLVNEKKTDFAVTAADQVLIARSQGADVVALFAVYQTSPQGVMVHKARNFTSLADVFNHPGTLQAESNSWLTFCQKKYGTKDVKIIAYDFGIGTFMAKPDDSQQCFVTAEPVQAEKQGGDPQTFLIADSGYNPYTTVLITRSEVIRNNPALVKSMVTACREGWRQYLDDPTAANNAMAQLNHDMDLPTFAKVAEIQKPLIETAETKKAGLGTMTTERWETLSKQLVDLGVIKSPVPSKDCFIDLDQTK